MLVWYQTYLSRQILLFTTWTGIRNKQTTGTGSKRLSFNLPLIGVNIELVITENGTRYKTTESCPGTRGRIIISWSKLQIYITQGKAGKIKIHISLQRDDTWLLPWLLPPQRQAAWPTRTPAWCTEVVPSVCNIITGQGGIGWCG